MPSMYSVGRLAGKELELVVEERQWYLKIYSDDVPLDDSGIEHLIGLLRTAQRMGRFKMKERRRERREKR